MADTIEKGAGAGRSTREITLPARRTPIYRTVDVLVCGGGLAGAAAAVSAARSGANTLLVERNVVLGGNGPLSFKIDLDPCDCGIAGEVVARLRRSGDIGPDKSEAGTRLAYDPEALKYALLDLVRESGAGLLLSSWACEPIMRGRTVTGVIVENKSGRFAIPARVVIDATGDGDLAVRAGATALPPAEVEVMTLNARIGGIDFDCALAARESWPERVAQAKRNGTLSPGQPDTILLYGITEVALKRRIAFLGGARLPGSAANAADLTTAETVARGLIREFLPFLKTVPGFEGSFLVDVAGAVAIKPSRHIAAAAPLGAEGADTGSAWLHPAGIDNLLVTGRAASIAYGPDGGRTDAAALGEAAGRAAAALLEKVAA